MKPHEEEWIVHPQDYRAVCHLHKEDPSESLVIADLRADEPREVADLIAAAPDMARALLSAKAWMETMAQEDSQHPEYDAVCAALAKAGAL